MRQLQHHSNFTSIQQKPQSPCSAHRTGFVLTAAVPPSVRLFLLRHAGGGREGSTSLPSLTSPSEMPPDDAPVRPPPLLPRNPRCDCCPPRAAAARWLAAAAAADHTPRLPRRLPAWLSRTCGKNARVLALRACMVCLHGSRMPHSASCFAAHKAMITFIINHKIRQVSHGRACASTRRHLPA